jgi:hypothetical protein
MVIAGINVDAAVIPLMKDLRFRAFFMENIQKENLL